MSVQALGWVLEHSEAAGAARLVLIALANHADATGWCWPSMATIAREARMSEDTARRAVRALELAGGLEVHLGGGRRSNRYRLVMPPPADCGGTPRAPAGAPPAPVQGEPSLNRQQTPQPPAQRGARRATGSNPRALAAEAAELERRRIALEGFAHTGAATLAAARPHVALELADDEARRIVLDSPPLSLAALVELLEEWDDAKGAPL